MDVVEESGWLWWTVAAVEGGWLWWRVGLREWLLVQCGWMVMVESGGRVTIVEMVDECARGWVDVLEEGGWM